MAAKDELGRRGEDIAVRYLQDKGLVVLDRNWRCRDGEIDVVATERTRESSRLVVCEIKTRSGTRYGEPTEAVTGLKAHRIRQVTRAWLAAHRVGWCEIRFDVVAVLMRPGREVTLQHVEGAF
ncbi:YraN family protein [Pseudonocardia pini]|uniref:YraN family protein n=1 Tax=Pseudonocardia pini TaxID=2758030 RepID=UPI0015F124A0|nr:YraN family protein [Pseudonocardia pini]